MTQGGAELDSDTKVTPTANWSKDKFEALLLEHLHEPKDPKKPPRAPLTDSKLIASGLLRVWNDFLFFFYERIGRHYHELYDLLGLKPHDVIYFLNNSNSQTNPASKRKHIFPVICNQMQ